MTKIVRRIAMWSGPRNISTALMRAWENRPDTIVCDEPLYAHYLEQTSAPHPGADEIIITYETDWRKVVTWLTGPIEDDATIFYQKHMAHHMLPNIDDRWLDLMTNCFLIRDPKEMITSLTKLIPDPTLEDTGLPQQVKLFRHVEQETGESPPVLDAKQILRDPRRTLEEFCDRIGIEFLEDMLTWPSGTRSTDGLWEKYWYARTAETTSFCQYQPKTEEVPERLGALLEQCYELYDWLFARRMQP